MLTSRVIGDGTVVAACAEASSMFAFAHLADRHVSPAHAQPAWTLLLPAGGSSVEIVSGGGRVRFRTGVLLAPRFRHASILDGPYAVVFVDPWMVRRRGETLIEPLSPTATRRLTDALDVEALDATGGLDLGPAARELHRALGPLTPLDPRVAAVATGIADAPRLSDLAARVELSPSHVRALVERQTGVTLRELRTWRRLTRAMTLMPHTTTAIAATAAGFADQSHLTRVTHRLTGRTPGQIARDLRPA